MTEMGRMLQRIREGSNFLITSHRGPDGDALGSSLALKGIIEKLGKTARVIVRDRWADPLQFTPGVESVEILDELPSDYPQAYDALFTMECPEADRCGFTILPGPVINVDHHVGNEMYGEINVLDIEAPSVGEMLLEVADGLAVEIDTPIATAIYVSLASDTGFFRYTNTTLRAFEAATRLVRAGADPGQISLELNESLRPQALTLLGKCLETLEMHFDGRVSIMHMTDEMLAGTGANYEDSDGISAWGRRIAGVRVAAFLKETEGGTRVSLRAKPGADVFEVARRFGGGGHRAASGCFIPEPIEQARASLLKVLGEAMEQ